MLPERKAWATQSQEIADLRAELAVEHARLLALQDINAASGTILDVDQLLSLVASRITKVMSCDRTTMYLLDEGSGQLVSRVAEGAQRSEIRLPLGAGIAGWVAQTGRMVNLEDAYRDVRFDPEWDRRTGYQTKTILCVPMKNRPGHTMGVIQCLNRLDGSFTIEDEAMLAALASQAAVTIENGQFYLTTIQRTMELLEMKQQLERHVRELDVLMELHRVAASAADLDELFTSVLARALRAIEAEAGSILCLDPGQSELRFRCALGGAGDRLKKFRIPRGQGLAGWVAKHREPIVANDLEQEALHLSDLAKEVGYEPRNALVVPLFWGDGREGALELLNKAKGRGRFTDDDLRFASLIASQLSTAIQLAEARERRDREDRLSTIGQLLSSVLHDLRTPMSVIAGYTRELELEADGAARSQFAASVLRQVELINAMTRETLAFARGDRSLWIRKVYLKQFFEELGEQLRRELESRELRVELELEDRGVAYFDQHKVQRAIHNLARNSAEALTEGRAASSESGVFRVRVTRPQPDTLRIDCIDNGPGISEEVVERLFESFATHGKSGGTGLGLAIVKKVVDDHGGTIRVESQPGHTAFRIELPVGEPPTHTP